MVILLLTYTKTCCCTAKCRSSELFDREVKKKRQRLSIICLGASNVDDSTKRLVLHTFKSTPPEPMPYFRDAFRSKIEQVSDWHVEYDTPQNK